MNYILLVRKKTSAKGSTMEAIETIICETGKVVVEYDLCPADPRTFNEYVGTRISNNRSSLSIYDAFHKMAADDLDIREFDITDEQVHEWVKEKIILIAADMYEHSGITFRIRKDVDMNKVYSDYYYCTKSEAEEQFGDRDEGGYKEALVTELQEFHSWICGEVYCVSAIVINPLTKEETVEDSCGGYYGDAGKAAGIEEMKQSLPKANEQRIFDLAEAV